MNLIETLRRVVRRSSILLVAGLATLAATSQAAIIRMECQVAGYSTAGWIEVRANVDTGGKVVRASNGSYYTDRVQRGERLRIRFSPTGSEYCYSGALLGAYWDGGSTSISPIWLPLTLTGYVTKDPYKDNVTVWVNTNAGFFSRRIPIGTR